MSEKLIADVRARLAVMRAGGLTSRTDETLAALCDALEKAREALQQIECCGNYPLARTLARNALNGDPS